ncbi:MAG TPA: lytic transglycosylase domain-containing protein, partial [Burkholderiales bacterium]|nr:lytic transglycosylase domain-containing protein [Burkholderiales bacterium]
MIFKLFRNLLPALLCVAAQGVAGAKNTTDDALLGAYDAYRAGDPIKFQRHARHLDGHVLTPWIDYWRLSMRLEDAPNKV